MRTGKKGIDEYLPSDVTNIERIDERRKSEMMNLPSDVTKESNG